MQPQASRPIQHYALLVALGLAGVLQAFALAWPFAGNAYGEPIAALQLLSLAIFAAALDRSHQVAQAFWQSWVFASAWLGATFWWLFISLHTYGQMHALLAFAAVASLAMALALYYAAAGAIYRRWCHQGVRVYWRALAFAALWMLAELLRGTLFTGFPWGAIGYAHVDSPMRHWLPWVGVYGLSGLVAFACMAVVATRIGRLDKPTDPWMWGVRGLLVLGLAVTWWTAHTQNAPPTEYLSSHTLKVALVQGNVPQDLKFGAAVPRALRDYRQQLLDNTADFMALPETALPVLHDSLPAAYWDPLKQHYAQSQQLALIGIPMQQVAASASSGSAATPNADDVSNQAQPERARPSTFTNSAMALMPSATAPDYRYDKHHLVPFGEFVPPMFRWFMDLMHIPLGDFGRGPLGQPALEFKGERIAPNICYEDLFGEELAHNFSNPQQAPTLMINLSNIAWFGDSVAIDEHLHISRVRAMELGRPMLRATNTGATAIIDTQGVVTHRLASGVPGVLVAEVRGVHTDPTPFAQWASRFGLAPLWLLGVGAVLAVAGLARRNRHGRRRFGP